MKNIHNRRKFINKFFYAATLTVSGGWLISSCQGKSDKKDSGNDKAEGQGVVTACDDLSGVSAEEISKRESLAYVEETPIPDSYCANCSLYIPPPEEGACGGCMLFKGPVFAEAYCAYWAPIS